MLERTGPWLHRHHRAVLCVWAVLVVAGAVLGGSVFDRAEDVGPRRGAESTVVGQRLDRLEAEGEHVLVVLSGTDPLDPATSEKTAEVVFALREVPGVVDLRDPWTTNAYELVAEDRTSAAVEVELDPALGDDESLAAADEVADLLRRAPFPHVAVGGDLLAQRTFTDQAVSDAAIGEGVALVVLLALLVLARGSLAAGLVPVGAALASVALALLALSGLAGITAVSDFAVNVVTVLGLGLCVDYCLLLLHRYGEERGAGATPVPDALARTMATAGRTVVVSGLTVGSSIGALLLLGDPLLDGLAVGGVVAVLAVTLTALTLAPALLVACDRWLPEPGRGALGRPARAREQALLPRFARVAQARPWPVLLASTGVLVLLATPLLGLRLGASDARSLPPGSEAREVVEVIEADYPDIATAPLDVLADAPSGDPALERMATRMAELPDVDDVVLLSGLPGGWSRWMVTPVGPTSGPAAQRAVTEIRALDDGLTVQVGGPAAELVDSRSALGERAPLAILVVMLVAGLLLLRMTGSVGRGAQDARAQHPVAGRDAGRRRPRLPARLGRPAARRHRHGQPRPDHAAAAVHVRLRALDGLPRLPRGADQGGVGPRPGRAADRPATRRSGQGRVGQRPGRCSPASRRRGRSSPSPRWPCRSSSSASPRVDWWPSRRWGSG